MSGRARLLAVLDAVLVLAFAVVYLLILRSQGDREQLADVLPRSA
jgi:hypothetical protein